MPRRLACVDHSTGSLCPLVGFWLGSINGRSWQRLEAGGQQDQNVPRLKATALGSGPSCIGPLCWLATTPSLSFRLIGSDGSALRLALENCTIACEVCLFCPPLHEVLPKWPTWNIPCFLPGVTLILTLLLTIHWPDLVPRAS